MVGDDSLEVLTTTISRPFGVECKNRKCESGIVLGSFVSEFPTLNQTLVRCPGCGQQSVYSRHDLREFPGCTSR
jgi:hypothetical protein